MLEFAWKVNKAIADAVFRIRGKSELHRVECRLTTGGGDPKASATEMQTADGNSKRSTGKGATVW